MQIQEHIEDFTMEIANKGDIASGGGRIKLK